ncbi:hypothetical protein M5Y49_26115 [Escherichia coli]|nr:hypothetical protein [Escherichia coli]
MSQQMLVDITESISKRVALIDAEKLALEAVLMSIITTLPTEKVLEVKQNLAAITSVSDHLACDQPELAEARKAVYQRIFSNLK